VKRLLARVRALWSKEPVLVGTLVPLLATVGVLTQDQASRVSTVVTGVVVVAAQLVAAFKVRSVVTSPKTSAKLKIVAGLQSVALAGLRSNIASRDLADSVRKLSAAVEPDVGPQTPSGVSSANTPAVAPSDPPAPPSV